MGTRRPGYSKQEGYMTCGCGAAACSGGRGCARPLSGERPFGLGTVSSGTAATVVNLTQTVQERFWPRRLIIEQAVEGAAAFATVLITSIKIGATEILAGTAGIPITPFSADATLPCELGDKCAEPGQTIDIEITLSAAAGVGTARHFNGVVFGHFR